MKSNDVEYEHIKKRAYDREDWRHWRQSTQEEEETDTGVASIHRLRVSVLRI